MSGIRELVKFLQKNKLIDDNFVNGDRVIRDLSYDPSITKVLEHIGERVFLLKKLMSSEISSILPSKDNDELVLFLAVVLLANQLDGLKKQIDHDYHFTAIALKCEYPKVELDKKFYDWMNSSNGVAIGSPEDRKEAEEFVSK